MDVTDFNVEEECLVRVRVANMTASGVEFDTIGQHGEVLMEESFKLIVGELDAVVKADKLESAEEKPKHDPCRLLKKGDKVQVKKRNGRCNGKAGEYLLEAFCKVAEDEVPNERVRVFHNSSEYRLDPAYLELVEPVEENEPYYIKEKDIEYQVRKKYEDKDCLISVFRFKTFVEGYKQYYDMLPTMKQAREAAEAERDRLNSEYRKKFGTEVPCSEDGEEEK